jgi:hypothetical protein
VFYLIFFVFAPFVANAIPEGSYHKLFSIIVYIIIGWMGGVIFPLIGFFGGLSIFFTSK